MSEAKNILVTGCGTMGAAIAGHLDASGHHVVAIDVNGREETCLPRGFRGIFIRGNPLDQRVLDRAHVEGADLVVVTTNRDYRNLILGLVFKKIYHIENVFIRVRDEAKPKEIAGYSFENITDLKSAVNDVARAVEACRA